MVKKASREKEKERKRDTLKLTKREATLASAVVHDPVIRVLIVGG